MLVNLCIFMRIMLSDVDDLVVKNLTIFPCTGKHSWEPHSDTSQKAPRNARHEQYYPQDVQRHVFKSQFGYNLLDELLDNSNELRVRVKSPLPKVAKIKANRLEPYVMKYFEPVPRLFKPVTIIKLRNKNRNYPNMGANNPDLVKLPTPSYYYTSVENRK